MSRRRLYPAGINSEADLIPEELAQENRYAPAGRTCKENADGLKVCPQVLRVRSGFGTSSKELDREAS